MTDPVFSPKIVEKLLGQAATRPSVALILGSGLGSFAECIDQSRKISAHEVPGYPVSTVSGHAGTLVFGTLTSGARRSPELLVFQGRVHYYESGQVATAVAPIQLAHALGARTVILTNAAGGIETTFQPGDLMVIKDVLALNPLHLASRQALQQFAPQPLLDAQLIFDLGKTAEALNIRLVQGTYAWVHGPSYETAAEIRMLRSMGAHAVGMSTVPEVYEARRLGMRVLGISLISNMGTGMLSAKLSHSEVTTTAQEASGKFTSLLGSFLARLV